MPYQQYLRQLIILSFWYTFLHLAARIYTLLVFLWPFWPLVLRSLYWFLISCMLNLGVTQDSSLGIFYLYLCILLFFSSSLEVLNTHCILMFPPNNFNSSPVLSAEFHTTIPNCLLSISTWLPNGEDSSCPNLGSRCSPQTCFSCRLSHLSKWQLYSSSCFGQTPWSQVSLFLLSHPTSNPSANLGSSSFKVYPSVTIFHHLTVAT